MRPLYCSSGHLGPFPLFAIVVYILVSFKRQTYGVKIYVKSPGLKYGLVEINVHQIFSLECHIPASTEHLHDVQVTSLTSRRSSLLTGILPADSHFFPGQVI